MTHDLTYGVTQGAIRSGPDAGFARRGVIEGFYGTPWSPAERLDFIDFIGARGMNTFAYAPKDASALRHRWREPFSTAELAELAQLRDACERWSMRLMVCVSPGLTISYANEADVAALARKLDAAVAAGANDLGLLLDDIPNRLQHPADKDRFRSLAHAHGALVNALLATCAADLGGAVGLTVCPTDYCGYGTEEYLVELAGEIPASVDLFWTGRTICSATLDVADAEVFAEATRRPPLYWDNYPVNDVAMIWEAHLGPYRGRQPGLAGASRGVIANPMDRAESSKIPVATIADFLADPEGYDAEESWRRAITEVVLGGGNGGSTDPARAGGSGVLEPASLEASADVAAFLRYADNVRFSCLEPGDAPELSSLLEDLAFASAVGGAADVRIAAEAVHDFGLRLDAAVRRIRRPEFANPGLAAEQEPWLAVSELGAAALIELGAVVAGTAEDPDPVEQIAETLAPLLARLRERRYRVFGDVVDMTLADYVDQRIARDPHPNEPDDPVSNRINQSDTQEARREGR